MRVLVVVLLGLAPVACAPAQPESCAQLEARAAGDAGVSCAIADTCKEGGSSYATQEGASTCDRQCSAILDNGGCGDPPPES